MRRTGRQTSMIVGLVLTVLTTARANNIRVENVAMRARNVAAQDTVFVEFDLSWENSWRNDLNHDAAWVFVKFRAPGSNHWQHAYLSTHAAHHTAPGAEITVGTSSNEVSDALGMGVFVYRENDQINSVSYARTRLVWDYGQSGYSFGEWEVIDISVHAIEMVYVAEGNFYVGTGGTEHSSFIDGSYPATGEPIPFAITSEDAIEIAPEGGKLWDRNNTLEGLGGGGTLPAAFPKGHAAFYSMKYSITQGQYVEFLNQLTFTQQNSRSNGSPADPPGSYARDTARHAIHIAVSGVDSVTPAVYATDNPYVACNWLSWMDGAAYAQWAGLRPMTELEYEKACRGPAVPVPNEYPWGTADIYSTGGSANYANLGESNESVSQGNAIYTGSNPGGPARVGIFAVEGATTRITAGATYWGIMEMGGNLWEHLVSVGRPGPVDGDSFKGTHGDGVLSSSGHATLSDWPGWRNGLVTGADGSGWRGGSYLDLSAYMQVSQRYRASDGRIARFQSLGWRGVRTAPASP